MASPHAIGVAALVVSRFGKKDKDDKDSSGSPRGRRNCPGRDSRRTRLSGPAAATYTNEGRPAEFNALCEGDPEFNGFYGYGIVDAYAAVTEKVEFPK